MKINIQENFTESVNKQNHIASERACLQFLLYIIAVLTYFEIFYIEVFFTGKHLVVFDPFSKFMVHLTRLCDLTQPIVPPFLVCLVLRRGQLPNADSFRSSTTPTAQLSPGMTTNQVYHYNTYRIETNLS